jgi:diguanylate cyclase (GGDEF)-like protein
LVTDQESGPNCHHLATPNPESYLCVPLIAQGEAGGLLHFSLSSTDIQAESSLEEYQPLAVMIAEHIALALSNLSLRDRLRSQAIRDPLTGLFNRRYMEETLVRELRRATRQKTSVGVIMFDIDGLKPINDGHGHDAGDFVLRTLGRLMIKMFRGEDVPCRYGGDEFTLILPEASLADTWQRAEHLREAFKNLPMEHEGKTLSPITMSIGAVAFPDHGETAEELVQAGDTAAYLAKAEGGDRVMLGKSNEN